jgi:hypothetical protein
MLARLNSQHVPRFTSSSFRRNPAQSQKLGVATALDKMTPAKCVLSEISGRITANPAVTSENDYPLDA